jgi:hypothetical protein
VVEQEIHIALRLRLATGKVTLNEIVYRLQELRDPLMVRILEAILVGYDDLICERLSGSYLSESREGLGRHLTRGGDQRQWCRGRRVRKRGYRNRARQIATVFGKLEIPLRVVECCGCGARYSPLLNALSIGSHARKEGNFEREVIEAVIDTNYRRLIEGRSIDISLGGIHNLVVGSDLDQHYETPIETRKLRGLMADGTGLKQSRGRKGELRAVVGITAAGRVEPLGCFVNTEWSQIENLIRARLKQSDDCQLSFVFDGEPRLDTFLADVALSQRCTWHGPRGLYHALWRDGLRKEQSKGHLEKVKQLVGIEIPEGDYEVISAHDKEEVQHKYESSKREMEQLIETFRAKGYGQAVSYLESLSRRLFTHIELWLKTGIIAPKTISLLERVFRELGRRLKKIAWGWKDTTATKLSKMILLKQYTRDKWEQYWKDKLGIHGNFAINIVSVRLTPCQHF